MTMALEVAHAALLEVGLSTDHVTEVKDPVIPNRLSLRTDWMQGNPLINRAVFLGLMAKEGSEFLVRCAKCRPRAFFGSVPCIPVIDAIRGFECTKEN